MDISVNRAQVIALSKLEFSGSGHLKRLDMIANAFGYRNQATMMAVLGREVQKPVEKTGSYGDDVATFVASIADRLKRKGAIIFVTGPTNGGKTHIMNEIADAIRDQIGSSAFIDTDMLHDERGGREVARLASRGGIILRDIHGSLRGGLWRAWLLSSFSKDVRDLTIGTVHTTRDDRNKSIFKRSFMKVSDLDFAEIQKSVRLAYEMENAVPRSYSSVDPAP